MNSIWIKNNEVAKRLEERVKRSKELNENAYKKVKDRQHMIKAKAVEYLGGKCKRCGHTYPNCVYDFHHRDPKYKDTEISKLMGAKWERVVKELDKCELLCSNCHRILHYEEYNGSS